MFEPVLRTFSALDTIGFEHPFRFIIPLIIMLGVVLLARRTLVTFNDSEQKRAFERSVRLRRWLIVISRAIVILLVCAVFAGPFVSFSELVRSEPRAVILVDQTPSMENTDASGVSGLIEELSDRVSTESYAIDRSSWDAVRSYVREGTPLLIASDGMLSGDGLAFSRYARSLNASVNVLDLEAVREDLGISLEAPALTAAGVAVPITVRVDGNDLSSDTEYRMRVSVNDRIIYNISGEGSRTFEFSFRPEIGEKRIVAELDVIDGIPDNNVAARTMFVADKPRVHLVTEDRMSPLESALSELYTLETSSSIPDLESVSALVVDDLHANRLDPRIDELSEFVLDGGGLVVAGGQSSYDRGAYRGSRIESILPVTASRSVPGSPGLLSVALIIDKSASTGDTFADGSIRSIEEVEKNLAAAVYDDLKEGDNVGVIVFDTGTRTIQNLSAKNGQTGTVDRIASLTFSGGTYLSSGLDEAARMLARAEGTRYAILFSDGKSQQSERRDLDAAIGLRKAGIKLYTVSVGESSNEAFLDRLARLTGGTGFAPGEESRFEILFGTNSQNVDPEQGASLVSLVPWDTSHFISSGLELESSITGFNNVVPKSSARTLVVGTSNQPIVASAYFGLGRIVSVATDNGNQWSGQLFELDPELIARSVNYALGDAAKQQEFYVRADDPRGGDRIDLLVFSKTPLGGTIGVGDTNVSLTQIDEGEYRGQVELSSGTYEVGPRSLIVNYPREYVYPETSMASVASAASGKRFAVSDVDAIEAQIVAESYESSSRTRPIGSYFLLLAAIIFLIEVAVRRLTERRSL